MRYRTGPAARRVQQASAEPEAGAHSPPPVSEGFMCKTPGLHPDMLARVLRAAVVMRLLGVDRGAPPRFRTSALSRTLLDSNPHSVWPMVRSPPPPVCMHFYDVIQ